MVSKAILHGQMTETIAKKGKQIAKSASIKKHFFDHLAPWWVKKNGPTRYLKAK